MSLAIPAGLPNPTTAVCPASTCQLVREFAKSEKLISNNKLILSTSVAVERRRFRRNQLYSRARSIAAAVTPDGEILMKKFLLGTVALVALGMAGPASAADLAARPYTPAPLPMVAAIYDWSGFYIGANGGWGEVHNCVDFLDAAGTAFAQGCRERSGGLVGGQIGYRWQAGTWVFGLEAQGDWADLSHTRVSVFDPTLSTRIKTDGIGLFTGQIGYAWNAALLYVKGGAAVTSNRFSILDNLNFGAELAAASATRWGAAVGVGFEYGFAPNWSFGVEYDHLFMGDRNNSFSSPVFVAGVLNNRVRQDVDMLTLRINYRFGGYGSPAYGNY